MTAVGIDAIEIRTGRLKLDLPGTFAPAQGEDPEKYTKGLGLHASSFPDSYEDIVTMGANAAHRLMERKGLTPEDIGRIDVATESAFDNSKPVSTYVAGCLEQVFDGDFHHANKGERKFACVAATQAVDDAYNWIRAGRNRGKAAIVIDEDPSLVEISAEQGYGSADETDFLKPQQQFPSVDGKRSMQVYLARMREAVEDFESVAGATHPDDYAYIPYHTPFPGMVRKAGLLGYRHMIRDTSIEDELADDIGRQPRREAFDDDETYEEAIRDYVDALAETDQYKEWYAATVEPTLEISRKVGNWYTGSVHIARASALRDAYDKDLDLEGQRMLVGSYGSGAQAEVHAETVREGWREEVEAMNVDEQLDRRYELTFEEYEEIHDAHNHDVDSDVEELTTPDSEL